MSSAARTPLEDYRGLEALAFPPQVASGHEAQPAQRVASLLGATRGGEQLLIRVRVRVRVLLIRVRVGVRVPRVAPG